MKHVLTLSDGELSEWLGHRGHAGYRAAQIQRWLYYRRADSFDEMTDLPAALRHDLAKDFAIWSGSIARHTVAEDGTEKLLLQFEDRGTIECVLLRDGRRRSICVSTQVGCAMGCVFCASGLNGVDRNLSRGEIVEQMLRLQRLLPAAERLSHLVVMGMGEPLANLDQLLPALELATDQNGLGISTRRITISTVGLPKAIDRLSDEDCRFQLAVSLHAPNDSLRTELVPVNKNLGIDQILAAADRYYDVSGRRLTYEYVLLADINDQEEHARELVSLLRSRSALLNVIPYNPVVGLPYKTPSGTSQKRFRQILEDGGLNIQFRQRKGDKINAACGQLRRTMQ
ncbi:MAG: 23S rRNA (adenine(2503)-C(2))-methyltransferase RlmN [Pirellulaceae bacterium]|nr:23S rRNA (adenine(2503)-C(2))-methyltransferase RlmN [Pirellulaceae bacterium]